MHIVLQVHAKNVFLKKNMSNARKCMVNESLVSKTRCAVMLNSKTSKQRLEVLYGTVSSKITLLGIKLYHNALGGDYTPVSLA